MRQPKHKALAPRLSLQRLTSRSHGLRILLQQASQHNSLTDLLNNSVPEMFKNQFQVNAIEQQTLILTCHSASLMTRFRFKQQDIITQFNQKIRPKHIDNIKIKIRPKQRNTGPDTPHSRNKTQTTQRTISKKNAQILNEEAEHTDDIKLKNILLRLAKHSGK